MGGVDGWAGAAGVCETGRHARVPKIVSSGLTKPPVRKIAARPFRWIGVLSGGGGGQKQQGEYRGVYFHRSSFSTELVAQGFPRQFESGKGRKFEQWYFLESVNVVFVTQGGVVVTTRA